MSMSDNSYEALINRCAATFVIAVTTVDDAITRELTGQSCKCLMSAVAMRGGTVTDEACNTFVFRSIKPRSIRCATQPAVLQP